MLNAGSASIDQLTPAIYAELRKLAGGHLVHQRPGHTLQPTALVHEAWLRMASRDDLEFHGRAHFFGIASRVMRQVLVEHAAAAAPSNAVGVRPA